METDYSKIYNINELLYNEKDSIVKTYDYQNKLKLENNYIDLNFNFNENVERTIKIIIL